ncbi:hypothetical protein GEMRC1_004672 [Eukaryota sp. GEM-RC1]
MTSLKLLLFTLLLSYSIATSWVTCGSLVKLKHKGGFYLHSHDVKYGSGSHQQSVTCFPEPNDANSYWIVESGFDQDPCSTASPLKCNAVIRLRHMNTGNYLHSHLLFHHFLVNRKFLALMEWILETTG